MLHQIVIFQTIFFQQKQQHKKGNINEKDNYQHAGAGSNHPDSRQSAGSDSQRSGAEPGPTLSRRDEARRTAHR